jgi:outer membrane protein insertion porin family
VLVETPEIPVQSYEIYRDAYIALRDTERGNIKDIKITVEEADTGSLRFAAGVGSNAGIVGDITYTKTNFDPFDWPDSFGDTLDAFTGGGQILVLSVQPGTVFSRWRVAWTNPRVFDSPWSVGGEIYQTFWRRENWDEERLGYALRIGRRLGEDFSANLSLRDELVDVNDIDDDAPQLVFDFEGENRVTTLTLDMRLSRLNDFLNPTDGYLLQGSLEHGGLWGDIQFNKAIVRGDYYFEVYEDDDERLHVMRLRGQAGWASEFGDTRDLPVYERFYAGGAGSLRGFKFRGVGPMDNDDPIGGKAIWTAGAEYQFPLYGELFRGVAFVDTGSVALDWSDESIFDARVSVGVGLRIIIPFLSRDRPLAIDFGIPLVDFGEDETQIISFSFGSR